MNAKTLMFVICVEAYIYLLLYNLHYCTFKLLQSWQRELDKSGFVRAKLMNLSKAYDCSPRQFLIAKFRSIWYKKRSVILNGKLPRKSTRVHNKVGY